MHHSEKTYCVVVTFNPDISKFQRVMISIAKNKTNIVIVDNGSSNIKAIESIASQFKNTSIIKISSNIGIAAAQNKGITFALDNNAEMLWLSDQDTIYPESYINDMSKCITSISDDELSSYAAFGPAFINTNRGHVHPFIKFKFLAKKFPPAPGVNFVSHLIASGMLIPSWVFREVGLKQEDLFIDWVDLEWCWRATKIHGLKIAGCGDVLITHTLGDSSVDFIGRSFSIRSAFRHYFIVRNAVALSLHSKSLYFNQRVDLFFKAIAYVFAYPMLSPTNKYTHLKAVTRGFMHGLLNSLGPKH